MKSEKQLSIFGKQKSTKVFQIFAFQKIASEIDAETPKGSSAPISDAIGPDCWTHYIKFLKFDRREKNKVSKEQMNKMKNSTIKDLLEKVNISRKYKQYDKNTNKKNLDALIKESCYLSENEFTKKNWFQQIFDMKFLDLFSYYYNNEQPLQEIKIFGKKIILSKNTESFIALLQKYEIMEDKIVKYTKEIYFDDVN